MPHVFDHTPTEQEVFDEACRYFATSPGPSTNDRGFGNNACLYRNDRGGCCVAGHFIPDEVYDRRMDNLENGTSISSVLRAFSRVLPHWFAGRIKLLGELQDIHDDHILCWAERSRPWRIWNYMALANRLNNLAIDRGLSPAAVDLVRAKIPAAAPETFTAADDQLLQQLMEPEA
ncbi:hypothetical protein ACQR1W_31520 [Bradyrhizobium sp. HKCCYLS1011]|uniref:hypothetical protein n=1 Tax=Bradyrhizobium sp. HKCCYLS1011 TaxID=3420733 RepID=UPI003EC14B7C